MINCKLICVYKDILLLRLSNLDIDINCKLICVYKDILVSRLSNLDIDMRLQIYTRFAFFHRQTQIQSITMNVKLVVVQ